MSFFKKLKDRLFRSSSKIEEGIDSIVNDGGDKEPLEELEPLESIALRSSSESKLEPEPEAKKNSFLSRFLGKRTRAAVVRRTLDDEMLEALEELLISSDMGVETASRVTANLAEDNMGKKFSTAEVKALLANQVAIIMESVAKPMPILAKKPQVVLVVGVNGSGKTTTIG